MVYKHYQNYILIGSLGGAVFGGILASYKNYADKLKQNFYSSSEKIKHNIQFLKDNIKFDYQNCPRTSFHTANNINEYKNILSLSLKEQNMYNKAAIEKSICYKYNKLTDKSVRLTSKQIMSKISEGFKLIETIINKNSDPTLLIIGENHLNQASFLTQILLLTYLKQQNLSNTFLIERSPSYKKNIPIKVLDDINPIHFAKNVLNYNLIGIDPYNEDYSVPALSYKREEAMGKSIYQEFLNSNDKVTVATVGAGHLPFFKNNMYTSGVNILLLNIDNNPVELMYTDGFDIKRANTMKKITKLVLDDNIESISFEQVLDIYKDCLANNFTGNDLVYAPANYVKCSTMIDYSQVDFCMN